MTLSFPLPTAIASAAILGWCAVATAGDWPEFRGPTAQGITDASTLPLDWDPTRNVRWKIETPGRGWSSPVVAGDTLDLTTAVDSGGGLSLQVLAYRRSDGSKLWEREVFEVPPASVARVHQKNSHASPTPVVRDGGLYVHFGHLGTAKLDATTGEILWANDELSYNPVHGSGGCPVLVGDHLIFTADGGQDPFVAALDAASGKVAWKMPRDVEVRKTFSFCTPLAIEVDGQAQVIAPGSNVVSAFDPTSGEEIWRVRYDGYSVVPRPAFAHGLVYISTGYDSPSALAIRPDGRGDVTDTHVAWRTTKRAPLTPSFLVVGDELYMASDNGVVSCLDARTGRLHWAERATGPISASPLAAPGRIYLTDERGKTTVLATGKRFRILAENDLDEPTLASLAVGDSTTLYLRTESHLYALGTPE
ncbi:PQQ-like beta-propeller repeat protein [soil metagenome]